MLYFYCYKNPEDFNSTTLLPSTVSVSSSIAHLLLYPEPYPLGHTVYKVP